MAQAGNPGLYGPAREDWLALHDEDVLAPDLPIVDAHHHLWSRPGSVYLIDELLADLATGHRIIGTVFMECRSMYRTDGPAHLSPVGEVEFVDDVAEKSLAGKLALPGICAGIVGHADLTLGEHVLPTLEALKAASNRFRGIRQVTAWDGDATFHHPAVNRPPGLLLDGGFREGFAKLAPLGLIFDAFVFFTQIPELTALARAFPETQIVLDHIGAPLGVGVYAGRSAEIFATWKKSLIELAACPNVAVKLGGLGMRSAGFAFDERPCPPSSSDLAAIWRPYIETSIEAFGAERSMFESNFPPDKASCTYRVLWNAFKRLASGASESEKHALFSGTAIRLYDLDLVGG